MLINVRKKWFEFWHMFRFQTIDFFPKGGDIFTKKRICSLIELPDIQFNIPIIDESYILYEQFYQQPITSILLKFIIYRMIVLAWKLCFLIRHGKSVTNC